MFDFEPVKILQCKTIKEFEAHEKRLKWRFFSYPVEGMDKENFCAHMGTENPVLLFEGFEGGETPLIILFPPFEENEENKKAYEEALYKAFLRSWQIMLTS